MADEKRFSCVLAFDGKDDFVALPAMTIDYSQGFTVEAWVRWNSYKAWSRVIDFGNGQGSDNILLANGSPRMLSFQVFNGAGAAGYHPEILDLSLWIHLAGTVDAGGNMTVYKNGKPVASGKGNRPNNVRRTLNYFGKSNWPDLYLDAQMAELRIWNVARTQAQIEGNQNRRLVGGEPGLIGYWPFDDGAGPKAKDRGPLGNDGVINGATWENAEVPFGQPPTLAQVVQATPGLAVALGQLQGGSTASAQVKAVHFMGDAKDVTGAKFVLLDDTEVTFACARKGDAGASEVEYAFTTANWKGKSASFTAKVKKTSQELKLGSKSLMFDSYHAPYHSNIVFDPPAPAPVQVPAPLQTVAIPPLPPISASGVVNTYAAVVEISGKTIKLGGVPGAWRAGDRVLVIQMMGAEIDKTNTQSFGTVVKENSAGCYDWATIVRASSNEITLDRSIERTYNTAGGGVQVVRVFVGSDVFVEGKVEPKGWDGTTGGVIAMEAVGTIELKADIDAGGKGFRGGAMSVNSGAVGETQFVYPVSSGKGGIKGEGIAQVEDDKRAGRGALANGGGGGNAHNAGGGGGGHGGLGGAGGKEYPGADNGGIGGRALSFPDRCFMGGGGGGGHVNSAVGSPGGNGGGIVILRAKNLTGPAGRIIGANGNLAGSGGNDGVGGGGAGGTIWLDVQSVSGAFNVEAKGGNGGNCGAGHGSGGGGGGGAIVFANPLPSTVSPSLAGGKAGLAGTDARGAANGGDGITATRASTAGWKTP